MFDLAERVALVTGAAGHLGSAVCKRMLDLGASVVAVDLSREALERQLGSLQVGARLALWGDCDLTRADHAEQPVAQAVARFGRLDVVVNTVGTFRGGKPVADETPDVWQLLWRLNVGVALNVCRAAAPLLKASGAGSVVNVASTSALLGQAGVAAYSASKAALLRLTESLADELAGDGVTVNAVLPATLDTELNRAAMPDADFSTWVPPDDVAAAIAFLASTAARSITGAALPLRGRVGC